MSKAVTFFFAFLWACSAYAAVPERIVSMNLCTDELLLRLADPSRIAAVTRYPKSAQAQRLSAAIPTIYGEAEELIPLKPDLVLAGRFSRPQTVHLLKRLGVQTLVLQVPRDFEGIYRNIRTVAGVVGEEDRGEMLIREMKEQLAAMTPQNKTVLFYQVWGNVPGAQTFEDAVLEAAGAQNLAGKLGRQGHHRVSLEALIHMKPDILILSSADAQKTSLGGELLLHPAIRKGLPQTKILTLPSEVLRCGSPATVEVVKRIHDEL